MIRGNTPLRYPFFLRQQVILLIADLYPLSSLLVNPYVIIV